MFSFRELVESMEKKTYESDAPISRSTLLPLPRLFQNALIDCEESAKEETLQHTSNEQTNGHGKQDGFFEYSESQKELKHREVTSWEEKVVHPSKDDQTACTEKTDIKSLWKVREETDVLPMFKHGSATMKTENYSVTELFDSVERSDCTLPLLDLVHQNAISSFGEQDLDASNISLRPEHHLTCSPIDSKEKRKHNSGEDLLTSVSRCLSEDTSIQTDKYNQLESNRRTIRRMDAKYKIRDRVCRSVEQKRSHRGEEVNNASSTAVRKQRSENKVENHIPEDLLLYERQCAEISHHKKVVKETVSNYLPERHKTAGQGSWSSDLHNFITDSRQNATVATMPRVNNNQHGYSKHHRSTPGKTPSINQEYEWTALRLREYEEVKINENSRIKEASRGSQSLLQASTSGTSENIARNKTTHFARNSQVKFSNLRNKKDSKETNIELVKDLQNYNAHEGKRNRIRDPLNFAYVPHNEDEMLGDNDEPPASSPSPAGFRL